MDLPGQKVGPNSHRPQSRINPITGEDMALTARPRTGNATTQPLTTSHETYRHYQQSPRSVIHSDPRPVGIPRLNLRQVVGLDTDEKPDFTLAFDTHQGSARIGTERNNARMVDHQVAKQSSSQIDTKPYPKTWHPTAREPPAGLLLSQRDQSNKVDRLQLNMVSDDDDDDGGMQPVEPVDYHQERMYAGWTGSPYTKQASHKLNDKEEMEEEKRKSKMLETVLIDQLCRPVMSDPGQHYGSGETKPPPSYRPGMKRGTLRGLHDTKVKTDGSATEVLLSRRVRFEARVLSLVGRDAIRELTGFYFAADNTLTVYEFRQFGKTSKAIPFIKRGKYYRMRCGEPTSDLYTLADITEGNDIHVETLDQPLPDSSKTTPVITLRICDVDIEAKKSILLVSIPSREADEMWRRLQLPSSPELFKTKKLIHEIHEITRRQVGKRGIKVFTGVGRLLRKGDLNGDGIINKFELEKSLVDFRINLPQDKFDDLWDLLDPESESFLRYDEFMRSFVGEMNEYRKSYVIKAFVKMDASKRGYVTFGDVRKFYNSSRHPKVTSGECSNEEITSMFLDSFETVITKGEVTFREFEEYYDGLSLGVDDDREFVNILKNAWNV